jgi:uncharacterized LabA/DUF88 family protein
MDKRNKTYAFIDSQNLNLGVINDIEFNGKKVYRGWKLDFKKFHQFLVDKYHISKAYLFIGYMEENEELYTYLKESGFELVYKNTTEFKKEGKVVTKGNVDAELVLYCSAKLYNEYTKAVVVSGDGDFACLYEYLIEEKKLLKIVLPNKHRYSSLLRKYSKYFDYVSTQRSKLQK